MRCRSHSGRHYHVSLGRWLVAGGVGLLGLVGLLAGLTLYTPWLHHLAGDWTGDPAFYGSKLAQDNAAALLNAALAEEPPLQDLQLPYLNVWVEKNAFESLNRDIVAYGFGGLARKPRVDGWAQWSPGAGQPEGRLRPIWLGFRGTNSWHHQFWKPSLRVRFKRRRVVDGSRDHVLIAPEDGVALRNWLSARLARDWGLLTNREEHVLLFINRRFRGLYTRAWRFDESLLIREGRLPGPFFRLEDQSGPVFARKPARVERPGDWEVEGVEPPEGERVIRTVLEALADPDDARRLARTADLFDARATARWLAVLAHAASVHVDLHNVAFWLDTTTGRLVPLVIDANGYDWSHPGHGDRPPEATGMPLIRRWLEDPANLALYAEELYALLEGHGSAERVETLVRATWARLRPYVMSDPWFSEMGARNQTYTRSLLPVTDADDNVEALLAFSRERVDFLRDQLARSDLFLTERARVGGGDAALETRAAPGSGGGDLEAERARDEGFGLLVGGYAGVVARRLDGRPFRVAPMGAPGEPREGSELVLLPSLPRRPGPPPYALYRVTGEPGDYAFANRLTGDEATPRRGPRGAAALIAAQGIHPLLRPATGVPPPAVLGPGRVVVRETREFAPGQTLVVPAGSRVLMGPGASLFVRGPLRVEGTPQAPVVVRPLDPGTPFGVWAVWGEQSGGSRIRHLDMRGGSQARRLNLALSGMLSVRDCPDVELAHLRLGPNHVGDDSLHVVRSRARVSDALIEGAHGDAVDFDLVTGRLEGLRVRDPGNDGIDVSMGRVEIRDAVFRNCGDKCISAGEGTRLSIKNVEIEGCLYGVAAKDTSQVALSGARIEACDFGLSAYRKKWRWGEGGTLWARDVQFSGSRVADVEGDARSMTFLEAFDRREPLLAGPIQVKALDARRWPAWAR